MKEEQKRKLKKLIKELESTKGRHTELVSVYIPAGSNLQEVINMLREEYSLAQNVKDKTVRKNVMAALEKIIQHLRLFRKTPENGLIVFCGNVSPEPGSSNIKIWSIEPPEKLPVKIYRCDQVFILGPLKNLLREKEVFGLIVLDAKEANIGLLKGKAIEQVKKLESTVPSKTVKGGMCVHPNSLIQLKDGRIVPVKELKDNEELLVYSFRSMKTLFTNSFEIMERKPDLAYEIITKRPKFRIVTTPEHKFFVLTDSGIEEKYAEDLKTGDKLLAVRKISVKSTKVLDENLCQLLGYVLAKGVFDGNKIILFEKDLHLLKFYARLIEKTFPKKSEILKNKNTYELRINSIKLINFMKKNYPEVLKKTSMRKIPQQILEASDVCIAKFLRGVFDAGGYISQTVGIRLTDKNLTHIIQLLLLRFGILSSLSEADRFSLRITNLEGVKKFYKKIGFSSKSKSKKLHSILKKKSPFPVVKSITSSSYSNFKKKCKEIKKLRLELKLSQKDVAQAVGSSTQTISKLEQAKSKNRILLEKVKSYLERKRNEVRRKTQETLFHLFNSNLVLTSVYKKRLIKPSSKFYDLSIPLYNSFIVNGIVVHNSQKRYDRIRDDALNEFFKKVGEIASQVFLNQPELKGIIIGGPGPTKESFAKGNYLHYEIKKKLLGIKDTSYTGEYGLRELVKRSTDLLKKTAVVREREILEKFFGELQKGGNVVYGFQETMKVLQMGAVDLLLISEEFDWVRAKLKCSCGFTEEKDVPKEKVKVQICKNCKKPLELVETKDLIEILIEEAKKVGTKVEFISTDTREGAQFKELGGIGAFLRYRID